MKATVIRVSHATEKNLLESLQKRLDEFLSTPIDGKLPNVRFIAQSEYTPEKAAAVRAFVAINPHITMTIFWD